MVSVAVVARFTVPCATAAPNAESSMMIARGRETLIKSLLPFILFSTFLRQPLKSRFRVAQLFDFGIYVVWHFVRRSKAGYRASD